MVVERRKDFVTILIDNGVDGEVYIGVGEFGDKRTEAVGLGEVVDLLAQVELVDNVENILAVTVQVVNHVRFEPCGVGFVEKRLQGKLRGIIERITAFGTKYRVLAGEDAELVKLLLLFKYLFFCGFEQNVNPAKDHHRHYDVLILAFLESMYKNIVGDVPKKRK